MIWGQAPSTLHMLMFQEGGGQPQEPDMGDRGWASRVGFCSSPALGPLSPLTPSHHARRKSLTPLVPSPLLTLRRKKASCQDSRSHTSSSFNIPLHPGVRVKCGVFSQAPGNSCSYCPWLDGQLPGKAAGEENSQLALEAGLQGEGAQGGGA